MGGALAWNQSQLRIGGCPSNGTTDLIYPPLYTPFSSMHSALVPCTFFFFFFFFSRARAHFHHHSSLHESSNSSPSASFLPYTNLKSVAATAQGRWESGARLLAAAALVGTVRQHFAIHCFWPNGENLKEKGPIDCQTALLAIYAVDRNFIPQRKKITGKLIFGSDWTTHGELCPCMREVCHRRGWWFLQTSCHIKMAPMNWFPYWWVLWAWIGQFSSALLAIAMHPVVLLSLIEQTHIHKLKRTFAVTGRK